MIALLDFYKKMKLCPSYASGRERKRANFALQTFLLKQVITDKQIASYEEVLAIKMKHGEHKKGMEGGISDKPSVLHYLEVNKDALEKNKMKNEFIEKIRKSYEK